MLVVVSTIIAGRFGSEDSISFSESTALVCGERLRVEICWLSCSLAMLSINVQFIYLFTSLAYRPLLLCLLKYFKRDMLVVMDQLWFLCNNMHMCIGMVITQ